MKQTPTKVKFNLTPEQLQDIARRRLALGLTQEQMARLMNVTVWTYTRWERGKDTPSRRNYELLLELFDELEELAKNEASNWRELLNECISPKISLGFIVPRGKIPRQEN